jgi:multiple sugar transport system substrate-binding protein
MRLCALALALAAALPACGRDQTPTPRAQLAIMANAQEKGVNAQIASWLNEEIPSLEKQLGAHIQFLGAGLQDQDYKARAALDIKSGRAADVIVLDQFWVPEFARAGFILPLDNFLDKWPAKSQIHPSILEMGKFKGQTYLLVWNADLRMIFYNQDLFRQAGIPLPWDPRSWDDIIEAGRQIKASCPGVTPLQIDAGTPMDEAATMQGFFMVFLGSGGKLYDEKQDAWVVDSPAMRRTMQFFHRVFRVEQIADPGLQVAPKGRERSFELMSREKIAIYIESSWFYNSVLDPQNPAWGMKDRDAKIAWAPMPGGGLPGDPPFVSISGGDGLIINPHTPNRELAFQLLAALNDLDRQKRLFLKKPFTPTRRDLAQLPEVAAHDFISQTSKAIMPYTSFRPALPEYPEISFHLQFLLERIVTGQLEIDPALAEFADSIQSIVGPKRIIKK